MNVTLDLPTETLAKIKNGTLFPMAWTNDAGEDVLMLVPTTWPEWQRAHAIEILDPSVFGQKGLNNRLAQVALLVTGGDNELAWKLLKAGWSPHERHAVVVNQQIEVK